MVKQVRIYTTDGKVTSSIKYQEIDDADGITHLLETTVQGERFRDLDIIFMSGEGGITHCFNRKHIVKVELIHGDI
jgi:hypothetical protein